MPSEALKSPHDPSVDLRNDSVLVSPSQNFDKMNHRVVYLPNIAPNLVHWFNFRAAIPSNASKSALSMYSAAVVYGSVNIVRSDRSKSMILA